MSQVIRLDIKDAELRKLFNRINKGVLFVIDDDGAVNYAVTGDMTLVEILGLVDIGADAIKYDLYEYET